MNTAALCQAAAQASKNAYAPYSRFYVGAAVLTSDKKIHTGCNVENASYGLTICAERAAIVNAISKGQKTLKAIAISAKNTSYPCGACRQFMAEFGEDIDIYICDEEGKLAETTSIRELLPHSFDSKNLQE